MRVWLSVLVILSTNVICLGAERTTLTIASGNSDGIYFKLATALSSILTEADSTLNVVVLETSGSGENVQLIDSRKADIAFMQNDIAHNVTMAEFEPTVDGDKFRGLVSLYTEMVQIVGKKNLFIQRIDDLRGEPVSMGDGGSGTLQNAIDILRASNLKDRDYIPKYLSFSEIKNAMVADEISGAIITAGLNFPLLDDLAGVVNFIPLRKETLLGLNHEFPYFIPAVIPAHTYSGQNKPIRTVGMRSLLVSRSDMPSRLASDICSAMLENGPLLEQAHPIGSEIRLNSARRGMTLPLHAGARQYYRQRSIRNSLMLVMCVGIVALMLVVYKKRVAQCARFMAQKMHDSINLRLGFLISLLILLGTVGSYYFERSVNEKIDTVYKALWATIIYLLSGFEVEAFTIGGKVSALFLLVGGMGILGSVIGNIANLFMKEGVKKMPVNLQRHIVICNWSVRGEKIIKELHHPSAEPETPIVVLTDSEVNEKELLENSDRYDNVYFVKGKSTASNRLKAAKAHLAKSVIIISDRTGPEPDPKCIMTCLAIRQLNKEMEESHQPHIIVELMDSMNRQLAKDAGADEIVSAGFYRTGIMLQSARYHHLSDIFHELLQYEDGTSSIYIIESDKVPEVLHGKSFQEAARIFNENRDDSNPVILIGTRRKCVVEDVYDKEAEKAQVILNPRLSKVADGGKPVEIGKDDALVVFAHSYPKLDNIK